jgi:Tfp pilus assembly protein PilN
MIRINLLGSAKPKNRKPVIEATGGVSIMFAGTLIMLALALGGNGYYYWNLQRDNSSLQANLHKAEAENRRLADVKASYLEQEKVRDNYKRRVDVIDKLRQDQQGPVKLLKMMQDTVNSTDEVWLDLMTDNGSSVELKGSALSVNAVANLMRNLQNTGNFKSVELKETNQNDAVKDIQVFKFTLECEKGPGTQPPPPQPRQKPGVKS